MHEQHKHDLTCLLLVLMAGFAAMGLAVLWLGLTHTF